MDPQKNREYLNWLHRFYADRGYCGYTPIKYKKQIGLNGNIYYSGKLNTWTFNSLTWLYDLFYHKKISRAYLVGYANSVKKIPLCISDY